MPELVVPKSRPAIIFRRLLGFLLVLKLDALLPVRDGKL